MKTIRHLLDTEPGCWWYGFVFIGLAVVGCIAFTYGIFFLQ